MTWTIPTQDTWVKVRRKDGSEWVASKLYHCVYEFEDNLGCKDAEIRVPWDVFLPTRYDQMEIYEGVEQVWVGDIDEEPDFSRTGEIGLTAIGPAARLRDQKIKRHYADCSLEGWEPDPPVAPDDDWEFDVNERNNNGEQLYIRVPRSTVLTTDLISGLYYRLANASDGINQALYSMKMDWVVGHQYKGATDAQFRVHTYAQDLTTSNWETDPAEIGTNPFDQDRSGTLDSDTGLTLVFDANKTGILAAIHGLAATTSANTDKFWVKLTDVRVNGLSNFTGDFGAYEVIEDLLTNYAPSISSDMSLVSATANNIVYATGGTSYGRFVYTDSTEILDIMRDAINYEDWSWGFYGTDSNHDPQLTAGPVERANITWIASEEQVAFNRAGKTAEDVINRVVVEYTTANGRPRSLTRTYADAGLTEPSLLEGTGRTRTDIIQVDTHSTAAAEQFGDTYLTIKARENLKGEVITHGVLPHRSYGLADVKWMRPNQVIYIYGKDPELATLTDLVAADVLNGRNIARIVAVKVNALTGIVTAQIDSAADKLDYLLSGSNAHYLLGAS